jgi:drug/metabolite transporter (DMT)-like permease
MSSFVGVVLGDYFLFVALRRLGPRRTGVLFAANAPIAAVLGWFFLEEGIGSLKIIAICLGFAGICLAVLYGKRRDLLHVWEEITPPLWLGVGAGMCAAFGQAIGILILRPVMEGGADPMMTTLVRVGFAAACFCLTWPFDNRLESQLVFPSIKITGLITANSFFGISFGVVLLLIALETGSVAEVTILSSITPVLILPFVWFQTRYCPPWGAWLGAILVCVCSGLLVL